MDLDALREDLKYWDDWSGDDWPLGNLSNVLAAARAVLDSEVITWCTAHESSATVHDEEYHCDWLRWALSQGQTPSLCVIDSVAVVRVRLLAEEKR